jgi:hypothetical protein
MKDFRKKLLSLLNICAENHNESGKLLQLANLIQSEDYRELASNHAFRTEYKSAWTVDQLQLLDATELEMKESEIHNLAKMLRLLQEAILCGNAPSLTQYDFCSFRDPKSITKLIGKLSASKKQKNYSNIDNWHLMKIFDPATVKSAKECFYMLPLHVTKKTAITEADIQVAMGNRLYCVDIEQFKRVHRDFLVFSNNAEATIKYEKLRRKKHRLFKVAVVMMLFLITFACDQFGLFSEAYSTTFSLIMCLNGLLYLILG